MIPRVVAWLPALLVLFIGAARADDLFEHPVGAADLCSRLAAPIANMQKSARMQAGFVQFKHLAGFPQPLKSTGDLIFARGSGVIWHVATPYESTYVFDGLGIHEGKAPNATRSPPPAAMRLVSSVFLALFELDVGMLDQSFELFSLPRS
ncbi:MAG: outer membrane lipoprotein carrier protein LolA, partial [Panacagrimonas sp.]